MMYYLICAYLIVLPLVPYETFKIKNIYFSGDWIFTLIVIFYGLKLILDEKSRKRFRCGLKNFFSSSLELFMVILLAAMFVSVTYAMNKTLALKETIRFANYLILYFIIKYECNSKRERDGFIKSYIFVTAVLGVLGIAQYIAKYKMADVYGVKRITATLDNPNNFAAYLILILFPLIMLTIAKKNIKERVLYGIISSIVLINIVLTASRNALLAIAIGLMILAVVYSWKLIYGIGAFGILSLLVPKIRIRIIALGSGSQNDSRIKLWETALKMIKDHPILGVGNGNFISNYWTYVTRYPYLNYGWFTKGEPCHNSYLKVESELGIVGIVSFLGILVKALLNIRKCFKTVNDNFYKAFYLGFFASMVAFYFMNISDELFFVPKTTTFFWVVLAISEGIMYKYKTEKL